MSYLFGSDAKPNTPRCAGNQSRVSRLSHALVRRPMTKTQVGHCKADSTGVYIGRGKNNRHMLSVGKPNHRGWLGNPFTLENHTRSDSIQRFRIAFEDKLDRDTEFREAVKELEGKTLGCWCQRVDEDSPACHGEVIAEWVDKLNDE